jgi:hypothetical protein
MRKIILIVLFILLSSLCYAQMEISDKKIIGKTEGLTAKIMQDISSDIIVTDSIEKFPSMIKNDPNMGQSSFNFYADKDYPLDMLKFHFNEVCGKVLSYNIKEDSRCLESIKTPIVESITDKNGSISNKILDYKESYMEYDCLKTPEYWKSGNHIVHISAILQDGSEGNCRNKHNIDWIPELIDDKTSYLRKSFTWWNGSVWSLTTGLTNYWKLDNYAPFTSPDSIGTTFNFTHQYTIPIPGKINNATGLNCVSAYMNTSSGVPIIPQSSNPFTISVWHKTNYSVSNGIAKVIYSWYHNSGQFIITLWNNGGVMNYYGGFRSGTQGFYAPCNITNDGLWHNIVIIYTGGSKGSAGSFRIWQDGVNLTGIVSSAVGSSGTGNVIGLEEGGSAYGCGGTDELGIWNRELNLTEIPTLYSLENNGISYPFNTSPIIIFNNQIPPTVNFDLVSSNNKVKSSYNVSNYSSAISVNFYWKMNTTYSDTIYYVNGTKYSGFQNTYDTLSYSSTQYNFSQDDNILRGTYNIPQDTMELRNHLAYSMNANNGIRCKYYNFTPNNTRAIYEDMMNTTSTNGLMTHYFCNSSYDCNNTGGRPDIDFNCYPFGTMNQTAYNHTHNVNSSHNILPLRVNASNYVGTVKVTPEICIVSMRTIGNWNIYYISDITRPNQCMSTNNGGVSWNTLSGTSDSHIHFGNDGGMQYVTKACVNDSQDISCTPENKASFTSLTLPPTSPIVLTPINTSYNISPAINISWLISIPNASLSISRYNGKIYDCLSLAPLNIFNEPSTSLSYLWAVNVSIGQYYICVTANDSINQISNPGCSECFTIFNSTIYQSPYFNENITDYNANVNTTFLWIGNFTSPYGFNVNMSVNNNCTINNLTYSNVSHTYNFSWYSSVPLSDCCMLTIDNREPYNNTNTSNRFCFTFNAIVVIPPVNGTTPTTNTSAHEFGTYYESCTDNDYRNIWIVLTIYLVTMAIAFFSRSLVIGSICFFAGLILGFLLVCVTFWLTLIIFMLNVTFLYKNLSKFK